MELTGRLGGAARDFLKKMELCHNTRLGDSGPAAFRKLRVKLFLEFGMVLARGTAKILEVARDKIRRRVVVYDKYNTKVEFLDRQIENSTLQPKHDKSRQVHSPTSNGS